MFGFLLTVPRIGVIIEGKNLLHTTKRKNMFNDTVQHNKPHVHVSYGEYRASVGIDGELLAGSLPQKQYRMLTGWLALHEDEAYAAWNRAVRGEHFDKIDPLV